MEMMKYFQSYGEALTKTVAITSPSPTKPHDLSGFLKSLETEPMNKVANLTSTTSTKKHPLRYSCEKIHVRMKNGLCIFCEGPNISVHQLKHKRF